MTVKERKIEAEGKRERRREWVEENSLKEGGTNVEGNGAQTHQASVLRAGQPAEKKHPHKHQQNGVACLGIVHSASGT